MIRDEEVYQIGVITRTHGIRGEVAMSFTDDVWDRAEADYLVLRIEGILVPFFMEEYRFRSNTVALIKFQDYDSADEARELCGCEVYFPHALTPERSEDEEYTWRYFTGFRIVDALGGELGTIDHVDDSTANVLFAVGGRLIPAAEDFIQRVDHRERTLYMHLPEGLLTINMNAYFRCADMTSFTVPTTVTTITGNPCVGATSLRAFNVAEGSEYFATYDGCLYATGGFTVKGDPNRDGDDVPAGLTALVGVPTGWQQSLLHVPEGVTVIANQAAREATSITEVELPSTLVEIRPSAFSSITGITKVTCLATTPPNSGEYFTSEVYQNATLYVPMNSVELYRAAAGWCNFQNIVGIDTGGEPGMKGDVNGDKKVDIDDVTALINCVLTGNDSGIIAENADVFENGAIDIDDVTTLINFVLTGAW